MKKQTIIEALRAFINQRSRIDARNYACGDWKRSREAFMGDYRPILKHGRHAREMLRAVELRDSITADDLAKAFRAYSGRLSLTEQDGKARLEYTTGQYFPTEYRNAACAVLAQCLWDYWRDSMPSEEIATAPTTSQPGIVNCAEYIRRMARRELGRSIAATWFK